MQQHEHVGVASQLYLGYTCAGPCSYASNSAQALLGGTTWGCGCDQACSWVLACFALAANGEWRQKEMDDSDTG